MEAGVIRARTEGAVMQSCERCTSTDLFHMDLTVGSEETHFAHCRACEHRWWTQGGDTRSLELSDVLTS